MMRLFGLLAALLAMGGCAHSDEWTKRDTWMQVAVTATLAADAYTTSKIQYANLVEDGFVLRKVLGSKPATRDTYIYFGSLIISHYFITRMLPAKWRPYWQGWELAVHGRAVVNNCNNGLC